MPGARCTRRWSNGPSKQAALARRCRAACLEGPGGRASHWWYGGVEDRRRSKHQGETTMDYYAGIDLSLECSSVLTSC
jgi:hypothetical protein